MSVSSCICYMFASCVHIVTALNAELCMTCSLLKMVEDAGGDHMDQTTYPSSLQSTYDMTTTNRRTFPNYKKADRTHFTEDTESAFVQTTIPIIIHTANIIFTNIKLLNEEITSDIQKQKNKTYRRSI